ncbi:tetratricopeptide repeat protein [Polaribacter litorisediminis]|uniref:tetratricopeptide repeat-containing sensor histidine kinase n=1 Tax=Polaribacter litorisediminis TaxID=1908341 RepID=UPI001CBCB8A0|nr:tetratricopeptide repeat-containing sensor histidine kinase [Polaribacter litorisediminis]UAM98763.1 tetratricopeptide repeat protein [Polaribacter litorisediminis]
MSSVFLIKNDSLIELKYGKALQLFKTEKFGEALEKSLDYIDECKEAGNEYWIYKFTLLLADIYDKSNKFEKSIQYYRESLSKISAPLTEKNNAKINEVVFAEIFLKIGSAYHKLSQAEQENNKYFYLDSAKVYYEKLERFPQLNPEIKNIIAKAYSNLSGIYEQDSIYDKAENYVRKAIEVHRESKNSINRAAALNNLGNIFLSQKKYKKSKEIYKEAIHLIKNDSSSKANRVKSGLYFNLAWAMRNLKDYKAYDLQEQSHELQGDIREKEISGIIEQITQEYNFEAQKELFQEQEEVKRLRDQRIFWSFAILGLLIIISLVYFLNLYKLKQKNLALKLKQVALIQNQNLEKLKSETQVRILNATIDGKESERKEIAETLHDSVSALLSSANLHLQAARKQFNGSTIIEIDKTQKIIVEASQKIRDLSHNLVSSVLLKFGLNFAVRDIAEKYSNSELHINTDIKNTKRYHQSFEIKVYHIIQEFVNNILKHSKADNALIELKEKNNKLILVISDDGIGFDRTKINMKKGIGISQIEARIQMMKGKFEIESSLNNGTKIFIELPVL